MTIFVFIDTFIHEILSTKSPTFDRLDSFLFIDFNFICDYSIYFLIFFFIVVDFVLYQRKYNE